MKQMLALALTAALLLTLGGCGKDKESPGGSGCSGSEAPPAQADNFPVVVRDEDIPAAPQAVVSLSPGTTEMLFAMGYGSRVVGIGDYDDHPAGELDRRHRCGTVLAPLRDIIQDLEPDLVVAAAPLIESDLVWFQQQDIPVLVLGYAPTLAELEQNYRDLALALEGSTDGAAAGAAAWESLTAKLGEARALSQGKDPAVAILLREMSYAMATGDTFEQELFDAIGLINDAQRFSHWTYDKAEVKALEPEVIFAAQDITPAAIKESAVYKPVKAVKNGKILSVDLSAFERQTPRMFDILLEMAAFAYG